MAVPGFPGGRANDSIKGEATVVDLGNGKYLFALIKDAATLAQFVVLEPEILDSSMSERGAHLEQVGRKGIVPLNKYPMLVTFTDINNPASVKLVDPNDLAASFGCSADGNSSTDNSTSSAKLSMDAYNQGYGKGISHGKTQIGSANIVKDSEQMFLDPNAPEGTSTVAKDAGFYAVSYTMGAGETVISYLGTDQNISIPFWSDTGSDLWNGYGTSLGDPTSYHGKLAAEFYQAVTGTSDSDPRTRFNSFNWPLVRWRFGRVYRFNLSSRSFDL